MERTFQALWIQGTGLIIATLLNDSKVKRVTIEHRDLGVARLGISHQYLAPELVWPCVY
jgi:hypothetical protein